MRQRKEEKMHVIEQIASDNFQSMVLVQVLCAMIVLVAIFLDLVSGLRKAKERGEVRTSYALSRTTMKCLTNLGVVMIMAMCDYMVYFSHLYGIIGVDLLADVPVLTILVSLWLCWVQACSIRENADSKSDEHAKRQLVAIIKTLSSKDVQTILEAMGKVKKSE